MSQAAISRALLDPDRPTPGGLVDPTGSPAGRRFAVYRNNVAVGLTEALRQTFPMLERLLGAEFFTALAGVFWRAHPPGGPVLMGYGDEMPNFLMHFPPVAHLPYLADVARLELTLRDSYHAADSTPVGAEDLARLEPDALITAHLRLAPSLRLLPSDWPIYSLWRAHHDATAPKPRPEAQTVLILRPDYDPIPHLLPPAAAPFVAALARGAAVGAALDACSAAFDLSQVLGLLLEGAAITSVTLDKEK